MNALNSFLLNQSKRESKDMHCILHSTVFIHLSISKGWIFLNLPPPPSGLWFLKIWGCKIEHQKSSFFIILLLDTFYLKFYLFSPKTHFFPNSAKKKTLKTWRGENIFKKEGGGEFLRKCTPSVHMNSY